MDSLDLMIEIERYCAIKGIDISEETILGLISELANEEG
jgi:hypothetical protein